MLLITLVSLSFGYSTGKTGSSISGCTCHSATPSADTVVSFAGATTVEPGETVALQFIVENSGEVSAGLDVTASDGTLAAGANTQLDGADITHTSPQPLTATFEFTWTAPAVEGTYTLYGAGNAVNLDGRNSSDDEWNTTTTTITVSAGTCAEEDNDGDGYDECDGDCDDLNAAIHPGENDICDGVDKDCDGAIDEDAVFATWYLDADDDGYGDATQSYETCEIPAGYAPEGTDCNDADATINPRATEVWYDGTDQNCDGNDDDQDGDGVPGTEDCDDLDPDQATGCDTAPPDDTGPGPDDSGRPDDSGGPDDSGPGPDDSGPGPDDSGPGPDDTGTPAADDSGTPSGDTGRTDSAGTKPGDEGCGCNSGTPMAALLPLLLAALAGRRRG